MAGAHIESGTLKRVAPFSGQTSSTAGVPRSRRGAFAGGAHGIPPPWPCRGLERWSSGAAGGAKPRTLLTALLLDEGHVVRAERLIEAVWNEDPPDTARAVLQTYISSLRRSFERAGMPPIIVSHQAGYLADVPAGAVDRAAFETLVAEGRRAAAEGRHEEASERLRAALALWRGPALGGIGESFLLSEARRLDELRLTVTEERISAELKIGLHEQVIGELTALVARHPVHERLRYDLMVTLNGVGRRGDALAVYRQGVEVLAEELGIDPGPELRLLHEGILRGDPDLFPGHRSRTPQQPEISAPGGPAPAAPGSPHSGSPHSGSPHSGSPHSGRPDSGRGRPYQLPPVTSDFTGRTEEIALLQAALTQPSAMPVCVILGAGGTGKSTLALRVAHEMARLYP